MIGWWERWWLGIGVLTEPQITLIAPLGFRFPGIPR